MFGIEKDINTTESDQMYEIWNGNVGSSGRTLCVFQGSGQKVHPILVDRAHRILVRPRERVFLGRDLHDRS
jgi:hypothetical protein